MEAAASRALLDNRGVLVNILCRHLPRGKLDLITAKFYSHVHVDPEPHLIPPVAVRVSRQSPCRHTFELYLTLSWADNPPPSTQPPSWPPVTYPRTNLPWPFLCPLSLLQCIGSQPWSTVQHTPLPAPNTTTLFSPPINHQQSICHWRPRPCSTLAGIPGHPHPHLHPSLVETKPPMEGQTIHPGVTAPQRRPCATTSADDEASPTHPPPDLLRAPPPEQGSSHAWPATCRGNTPKAKILPKPLQGPPPAPTAPSHL